MWEITGTRDLEDQLEEWSRTWWDTDRVSPVSPSQPGAPVWSRGRTPARQRALRAGSQSRVGRPVPIILRLSPSRLFQIIHPRYLYFARVIGGQHLPNYFVFHYHLDVLVQCPWITIRRHWYIYLSYCSFRNLKEMNHLTPRDKCPKQQTRINFRKFRLRRIVENVTSMRTLMGTSVQSADWLVTRNV